MNLVCTDGVPSWRSCDGSFRGGPPAVDVIMQNIFREEGSPAFTITRFQKQGSIDELFISIADDVRDGLYSLVSVNASRFHLQVTCMSKLSFEELRDARKARAEARENH